MSDKRKQKSSFQSLKKLTSFQFKFQNFVWFKNIFFWTKNPFYSHQNIIKVTQLPNLSRTCL